MNSNNVLNNTTIDHLYYIICIIAVKELTKTKMTEPNPIALTQANTIVLLIDKT